MTKRTEKHLRTRSRTKVFALLLALAMILTTLGAEGFQVLAETSAETSAETAEQITAETAEQTPAETPANDDASAITEGGGMTPGENNRAGSSTAEKEESEEEDQSDNEEASEPAEEDKDENNGYDKPAAGSDDSLPAPGGEGSLPAPESEPEEDILPAGGDGPASADTDADADPSASADSDADADPDASADPDADPAIFPAFTPSPVNVDGVRICVSAPEGVFPEGASLSVQKAPAEVLLEVDAAVEDSRSASRNVAASYTFDIKVLAADGETELQPKDGSQVAVSFSLAAVAEENLDTSVYHISEDEDTGALSAEELEPVAEQEQTVTVQTGGFSYYTVEFTYVEREYTMTGDTEVPLSDILAALGLNGEVTSAKSSNEALFTVRQTAEGWTVSALQPFDTPETLTVVIGGFEYAISVTDTQAVAEYDGTQYETLQAAMSAATAGGEVTLLASVNEGDLTFPGDKVEINLNGYTLTIPSGKKGFIVRYKSTEDSGYSDIRDTTIRNGTITGPKTSLWIDTLYARNLTLKDLTFTGLHEANGNSGVCICRSDAVMTNCVIEESVGSNRATTMVSVESGTLVMQNCTIQNCSEIAAAVEAGLDNYLKTASVLTMENCRITGNTGTSTGGLDCVGGTLGRAEVTLKNTVITGNRATNKNYSGGGATLRRTNLTMEGGAIYSNAIPDDANVNNAGADIYIYSGCVNATLPKAADMTDGAADLKGYQWMDTISNTSHENGFSKFFFKDAAGLKVDREPLKVARNMRTGTEYLTLAEAVADAQAGDTIQLCAADNGGGHAVSEDTTIAVDKMLTIDLNGHHLAGHASTGKLFQVKEGACLSIIGGKTNDKGSLDANEIDGSIENNGELEIYGAVTLLDKILHRGKRFFITGSHGNLRVSLGRDKFIEADAEMTADSLRIYLLDAAERTALNDRAHDHEDVLVCRGGTAALESVTSTPEIDNPHVRRVHKTGDKGEGLYLVDKIPTGIYIDGVNGDDSAGGSEEAPVKTFARAKELLEAKIAEDGPVDGIYVLNTVTVADSESWYLPENTQMIRNETCTGALVKVTGSLTLENIVIDGLSEGGVKANAPLVIADGGSLVLAEGAVLQNNTNSSYNSTGGGILGTNDARITLTGGSVAGNTAGLGGGIALKNGSTLDMTGGSILRNRALMSYTGGLERAVGGGVFLAGHTVMNLSGGRIAENSSEYYGGGISLGGFSTLTIATDKTKKATLNMTGGVIDGNYAKQCGGGIFIQANTRANVTAGDITNNRASSGLFTGGGIYVNSNAGQSFFDYGLLEMVNVLMTDNRAGQGGGGIGACPTSSTLIFVSSGAAIYGNDAPKAHDVLVDHSTGSNVFGLRADHVAYISHYMLGGGEAQWKRDGTDLYTEESALGQLNGHTHLTTHYSLELQAFPTEESIQKAREAATVRITGNYGGVYGGGLASNGNVRIGTRWNITAKKAWDDDDNRDGIRPASVKVRLRATVIAGGVTTEIPVDILTAESETELSDANEWQHTWSDLPEVVPENNPDVAAYKNLEITYTVEEIDVPAGYTCAVGGNMFEGYTVTNTHEPEKTRIPVEKIWDDEGHEAARPETVTVRLHDGHQGRTLELSAANGWKGSFEDLPVFRGSERIIYSLTEDHVPNYVDEIVPLTDGCGFRVTNTYNPGKREVSVVKDWFDAGHENERPESVTVELIADGVPTGRTLTLTAEGLWAGHFTDLPETKAGQPIIYTVAEKDVPPGYICTIEGDADTGFVVKNDFEPTRFEVRKVWVDDGHEAARPASITVRLHDGRRSCTLVLSEVNGWQGSFEDLPVFRNGEKIAYSLTEDHVENYTAAVTYDPDLQIFTATNTYNPGIRNIPVVKDWFDVGHEDKRPESVTVELYADGVPTGRTLTLTAEGRWVGRFTDLPETKAGAPIVYTIVEKDVPRGHICTIEGDADSGFVVKNTFETTRFEVEKVWADDGHEAARPKSITVRLHDGRQGYALVLSAANGWRGSFENLPVYRNGERIAYSLTEDHVENYTAAVDYNPDSQIFTVRNTYNPDIRNVAVVKDWFDEGSEDKRPESITVELYADDAATGQTLTLTAEGRWVGRFTDLPVTKAGRPIVYTIVENGVPEGYICTIEGDADTSFVVKNTIEPPEELPPETPPKAPPAKVPPKSPPTGDPGAPVPLLAILGLLGLIGAGYFRRKL